jgi:hypothetical protein
MNLPSLKRSLRMKWLLALTLMFSLAASAADVTGTWKGTAQTPNGPTERTFVFKVDGAKLTGYTSSQMMGKSTITGGKIEGDNLSFTITAKFQDNDIKLNYKGKVTGDEIHFTVDIPDSGQTVEYTAKKIP